MKRICDDQPLREHLQNELKRRQRANTAYSLRAFARDLNLNPGFLSTILVGKRGMSLDRWTQTFGRMGLSPEDVIGVSGLLSFGLKGTNQAGQANGQTSSPQSAGMTDHELSLEAFQLVSDWFHFALVELTQTKDFDETPSAIAARLGVSEQEAKQSLERLLRIGVLARDARGKLIKTTQMVSAFSKVPSGAIRSYHAQMLERAKQSLQTQAIEERDITGISVAINPERIPELREEIKKFRLKLARMAGNTEFTECTEVYQLEVALFRLSSKSDSVGGQS